MYAHILRFLLRALHWYQESKVMRAIHSITRPVELRYDDLLEKISILSHNTTDWASVISHAEQRDVHIQIRENASNQNKMMLSIEQLTALVFEIKHSLVAETMLSAASRIETRQALSEIQLSQFLAFLLVDALLDPTKAYQGASFLRNRRRTNRSSTGPSFWLDAKLKRWNEIQSSSLVIIKGTRKLRFHIKDFCVDSISILKKTQIPVIWTLKTIDVENVLRGDEKVSTIVLLKSLITQAVQINPTLRTDAALAPRLKAWLGANTEGDWLNILASVLQGIPLIYIIIDAELIDNSLAELTEGFSFPAAFLQLFSQLTDLNIKTVIKVAFVSYGSPVSRQALSSECENFVVPVVTTSSRKRIGKGKRSERGKSRRLPRWKV
jgi:hypothetical protein